MRIFSLFGALALILISSAAMASGYKAAVDGWTSHEDVARWMKNTWNFDAEFSKEIVRTIQTKGPTAAPVKSAAETFESPRGWCKDAANFAKVSLNQVNATYGAEYIFINNKVDRAPNHWVAGFKKDGKIYVIDYGAGKHWRSMMGTHGPYDSLDDYRDFLASLNMKNFDVDFVRWMPTATATEKTGHSQMAIQRAVVVLAKFDKDGDNAISKSEAPPPMKANFERLDKDGNKRLNEMELRNLKPR